MGSCQYSWLSDAGIEEALWAALVGPEVPVPFKLPSCTPGPTQYPPLSCAWLSPPGEDPGKVPALHTGVRNCKQMLLVNLRD